MNNLIFTKQFNDLSIGERELYLKLALIQSKKEITIALFEFVKSTLYIDDEEVHNLFDKGLIKINEFDNDKYVVVESVDELFEVMKD